MIKMVKNVFFRELFFTFKVFVINPDHTNEPNDPNDPNHTNHPNFPFI